MADSNCIKVNNYTNLLMGGYPLLIYLNHEIRLTYIINGDEEEYYHEQNAKLVRFEINECYRLNCILQKRYVEVLTSKTSECDLI